MEAAASLDTEGVKLILANQSRLEDLRRPYEAVYRDIDRWVDPFGAGGFDKNTNMNRDIETLFDITGINSLDRYTSAIAGITIPRGQQWHGVAFADKELMKLPNVQRWCATATDRMFAARYAPNTGFETQSYEDIRQEGKYGTSGMWIGEKVGAGMFYKTLHLSEIFIDENYHGGVDTVHRLYTATLRNASAEFGVENLSDKSRRDLEDPKKRHAEIEILHVIRPNAAYEPRSLGPSRFKVESLYIEVGEKHVIRRKGFNSMPIAVSRHITGPRDVYGRSPAMKVLATIKGANTMSKTILDAGNRAVDPPLLYHDDSDITKISTKPGGLTPGGVDEQGRQLVHALVTGAQLPIGLELLEAERGVVKDVFLEEFFRLLSNPSDRMTATQVLEQVQKEGVLIGPFASRRETEKIAPTTLRELDIQMRARYIPQFPEEVLEAGAAPTVLMTNPLARMAKADQVTGFTRLIEIGAQAAALGRPDALDRVNFDEGMVTAADVLGVPPSMIYSDDELADRRTAQAEREEVAQQTQMAPAMAKASLDAAKANEIADGLAGGGGL